MHIAKKALRFLGSVRDKELRREHNLSSIHFLDQCILGPGSIWTFLSNSKINEQRICGKVVSLVPGLW